jgi:hypothetical protein
MPRSTVWRDQYGTDGSWVTPRSDALWIKLANSADPRMSIGARSAANSFRYTAGAYGTAPTEANPVRAVRAQSIFRLWSKLTAPHLSAAAWSSATDQRWSVSILSTMVYGWNRRTSPPNTKKIFPVIGQPSVAR